MPILGSFKVLQGIATVLGRLLRVLRKIPVINEAVELTRRRLLNPITVRQVRDPSDPDLMAALELYQKRIPEDQRFEAADIIRWLRDDLLVRRQTSTRPTDWFLVAKYRGRVSGFILFHYFPQHRLAFCGYMAVTNAPGPPLNGVSTSLGAAVSRLLRTNKSLMPCIGLVFEVEDPRSESNSRKQDESLARIRRFCTLGETQGWSMRALDINYRQPKLSLEDTVGTEQPLLLMFARTDQRPLAADVSPTEVEQVLSFLYLDLYPEGFSTDAAENAAYRRYCATVKDSVVSELPSAIRSLSCAELVAQVRNLRRPKSQAGKISIGTGASALEKCTD